MEKGFFGLMLSYSATGILCFFALTGFRIHSVLRSPILVVLILLMTIGLFYLSYLCRKIAINSRLANSYEELRTNSIFFQKRVFQLFHFPLILLGIVVYKMNEYNTAYFVISVAILVQVVLFLSEWKLILRKLG